MYCSSCGLEIENDSKFCSDCGSAVVRDEILPIQPREQKPVSDKEQRKDWKRRHPKRPSVAAYFMAFLVPPFYFFTRKRIIAGLISLISLFIAIPLLFFVIGFFIWFANSIWAMWSLRYELMNVQVREQATAIAEELSKVRK